MEENTHTDTTDTNDAGDVTNALAQAGADTTDTTDTNDAGDVTNALAQAGADTTDTNDTSDNGESGDNGESAEDIEKAILEGESEFKGKWDAEQIKGMAPMLKELGVSKENASKLAVKLAEIQTKQMEAYELKMRQDQMARIKAQDEKNAKEFSKADYKQIFAGMTRFTKPDGCLRRLLTTTELGTDPEVLRILHHLGSASVEETGAGVPQSASTRETGWAEAFEQ